MGVLAHGVDVIGGATNTTIRKGIDYAVGVPDPLIGLRGYYAHSANALGVID